MIIATHEEFLRRLALHDERCIQSMLGICLNNNEAAGLDPKAQALARLAAIVALDASGVSTLGPPKQPWIWAQLPRRLSAP